MGLFKKSSAYIRRMIARRKQRKFYRYWLKLRESCNRSLIEQGYGGLPPLENDLKIRLQNLGLL